MCKSGNTALALDLLTKMEHRKVKPHVVTYSTIIDNALSLFKEMETKGFKPNVFTYNSIIGGFCSAGRWDDGAQFLRDMIRKEITPDIITFSALIDSFVKEGKLTEAKELYNEMITRGIDPDTITYNSLIYGLKGCMRLFRKMSVRGENLMSPRNSSKRWSLKVFILVLLPTKIFWMVRSMILGIYSVASLSKE
ncbi:BnaC08g41520D [Brassica napus]|uniref:BnaC08g41520D protein n=1 Tax=Brassica napus TaxID=3708 RepID=A0A078FS76_BRANA|nr:BnaC08g41520D [Brassica napus]